MDRRNSSERRVSAPRAKDRPRTVDFRRFKMQLIAALVLISSVPLVLFAIIIYEKLEELVRGKAVSHIESIVLQNAFALDQFRKERIHDLNLLAETVEGASRTTQTAHFMRLRKEQSIYRHLFLAGLDGMVLLETGTFSLPNKHVGEEKWFARAVKGEPFLGDVEFRSPGARDLLVAVPVITRGGAITGVIGSIVDFQGIAEAITNAGIGKTGEIYILNKNGVFLTNTRVGENRPGERLIPERFTTYFTEVGPHEYIDYRGIRVVRAYRRLAGLDWLLVGEQDSSEVLSDVTSLRMLFAGFAVLLIILVVLTGSHVSARMVRLLKTAYEHNKDLELQVIQKEKLASMGLLTAGIAHELNTPLSSALLYTQMMKEDLGNAGASYEKPFRERLDVIEEEIKRGSRIIRNLLDFSRQSRPESAVTDINDILDKLLDISAKLCLDRGITITRDLDEGIPLVKGNPGILHQVFMNIVANAVEAMDNGGNLSVSTRFMQALHRVVVDIQDTGPGIPEEFLGDVFDPFFTTKQSEEGTGLGLAISYSMVKKMGGNIRVTSSCRDKMKDLCSSTGTTFAVELPVYEGRRDGPDNKEMMRG